MSSLLNLLYVLLALSVVISLFGMINTLVLSVWERPLGVILAAAVSHGLSRFGVTFTVSVTSLVVFTLVAIAAGLIAAIAPARRASRLNVLAALQYE